MQQVVLLFESYLSIITIGYRCGSINYCGKSCQNIHWKFHKSACVKGIDCQPRSSNTTRRFVGLYNLGNTCYLNSSIQCLSAISPLSRYLLGQKHQDDLNLESKYGTKGDLITNYIKLLTDLWLDNKPAVQPQNMKQCIGRINPDFQGVAQHDAHEAILMYDHYYLDISITTSYLFLFISLMYHHYYLISLSLLHTSTSLSL